MPGRKKGVERWPPPVAQHGSRYVLCAVHTLCSGSYGVQHSRCLGPSNGCSSRTVGLDLAPNVTVHLSWTTFGAPSFLMKAKQDEPHCRCNGRGSLDLKILALPAQDTSLMTPPSAEARHDCCWARGLEVCLPGHWGPGPSCSSPSENRHAQKSRRIA